MEILPIITNALIAFSVLLFLVLVVSYASAKVRKKKQPAPVAFQPERIDMSKMVKPRKRAPESLNVTSMLENRKSIERSKELRSPEKEPAKPVSTAERFTKVETNNPNIYDLAQYQTRSTSSHKTILVKKRIPSETGEGKVTRFDKKSTVGRARMTIVNSATFTNVSGYDYYDSKAFNSQPVQRYYNY